MWLSLQCIGFSKYEINESDQIQNAERKSLCKGPSFGLIHDDGHQARICINTIKRKLLGFRERRVHQFTVDGKILIATFPSIYAIVEAYYNCDEIWNCCNYQLPSVEGYVWRFALF